MAEQERSLKSWAEIDESQRQQCLCDFSGLTKPLRYYSVVHRIRGDKPHEKTQHDVVLVRNNTSKTWADNDIVVFTCDSSAIARRAIDEAQGIISAAHKLYAAGRS